MENGYYELFNELENEKVLMEGITSMVCAIEDAVQCSRNDFESYKGAISLLGGLLKQHTYKLEELSKKGFNITRKGYIKEVESIVK